MDARPYRLVSETALRRIEERAHIWLRRWCDEWALDAACASVAVQRIDPAVDHRPGGISQPLRVVGDLVQAIHVALYSEPGENSGTLASQCTGAAAESLLQGLSGLVSDARQAPGTEEPVGLRPGEGWAQLAVSIGEVAVILEAPADRLQPPPVPAAALQPAIDRAALSAALRDVRTICAVELGCTELALNELVELKPGDVIVLDRSIHQPLLARLPDGEAALEVHLGRHRNRYAVQVVGANCV